MPPRRFCDCWFAAGLVTRLIGVIHEVDAALRTLIDREAGIRDVEVVFDAPTREWGSRRTTPTVDVYLYDIREDLRRRERGVLNEYNDDQTRIVGRHLPPRHFKLRPDWAGLAVSPAAARGPSAARAWQSGPVV